MAFNFSNMTGKPYSSTGKKLPEFYYYEECSKLTKKEWDKLYKLFKEGKFGINKWTVYSLEGSFLKDAIEKAINKKKDK